MNKEELKNVIPHRNSMLLIDEATKTSETTCEGKKYIKGDEWFLDGHFPGNPVVPGVILCEMMAQASSVIIAEVSAVSTPYFTGIEKAKFNLTKRQETKDINLGTSLGAYADYRIIYSWCNDMKLDPKNIYSKGLRDKSAAFSGTDKDFWKTI